MLSPYNGNAGGLPSGRQRMTFPSHASMHMKKVCGNVAEPSRQKGAVSIDSLGGDAIVFGASQESLASALGRKTRQRYYELPRSTFASESMCSPTPDGAVLSVAMTMVIGPVFSVMVIPPPRSKRRSIPPWPGGGMSRRPDQRPDPCCNICRFRAGLRR